MVRGEGLSIPVCFNQTKLFRFKYFNKKVSNLKINRDQRVSTSTIGLLCFRLGSLLIDILFEPLF